MDSKIKFDNYEAYYFRLVQIGKAMFALYDCCSLSSEQIELLATASDKEKINGMDIVVGNRLVLNKNYNTYRRNVDAIKSFKRIRVKK